MYRFLTCLGIHKKIKLTEICHVMIFVRKSHTQYYKPRFVSSNDFETVLQNKIFQKTNCIVSSIDCLIFIYECKPFFYLQHKSNIAYKKGEKH